MRTCFYCGHMMQKVSIRHRKLERTTDHLTPRSRGGTRSIGNTVSCHRKCNEDKGNRTLEEYRAIVAQRCGVAAAEFKFPGELKEPLWLWRLRKDYPDGDFSIYRAITKSEEE